MLTLIVLFFLLSQAIDESYQREYSKFRSKFQLSTHAVEIGSILDEEVDVPRHYAELVPAAISADEFWRRYFFKLDLLQKGSAAHLDLDEEEDIAWDSAEKQDDDTSALTLAHLSLPATISNHSLGALTPIAAGSDSETEVLKGHIRSLAARIADLERIVSERDEEIKVLKESLTAIQQTESVVIAPAVGSSDAVGSSGFLESDELSSVDGSQTIAASTSDIPSSLVADKPVGSNSNLANLDDEDWENSWS